MAITVTWMDGKQETYRCQEWHVDRNGRLLWLDPEPPGLAPGQPRRCIPLASVRIWTVG